MTPTSSLSSTEPPHGGHLRVTQKLVLQAPGSLRSSLPARLGLGCQEGLDGGPRPKGQDGIWEVSQKLVQKLCPCLQSAVPGWRGTAPLLPCKPSRAVLLVRRATRVTKAP